MLVDTVRRTIRRHNLASPATRVVIALSGGSDSVALAHLLGILHADGELTVAGVAHFNHRIRADADRDEEFCRLLTATLGFDWFVEREDVLARAARDRQSLEHAARTARHAFFERACAHFSADVVALGHTRDDQAETFLLRLLRGAGPRGLSAMHPRSGRAIRPLLDCGRAELRAFLAEGDQPFVEDETNSDVAIPRNRVRAELLPVLRDRFNPSIVDALAHQAELARDEWLWMLDELGAHGLDARVADGAPGAWSLDRSALVQAPRALRRVALWCAMNKAAAGRTVSLEHVDAALHLVEADDTRERCIDAPGHVVERIGDRVVLRSGRSRDVRRGEAFFQFPLSVPGEVLLAQHGCIVSAELVEPFELSETASETMSTRARAVVSTEGWRPPLSVRSRRPGDRFRPFGLGGQKKLQDFLVDRKVARGDRDRVPIVVDRDDRILWVAGHEIDEAFRVTEASRAVLILTLRLV